MSNITEIKRRINGIRDTKKMTNAMYLIASNKVRKAKASLERTRPYFSALLEEIDRMFDIAGHIDSPYFDNEDGSEKKRPGERGYLIITADKGLAGAYNQNVIKKVEELTAEEGGRLFVVGEYGRQTFSHRNMPIDPDFRYTAQNPRLHAAREICELLLEKFDRGELKSIDVVYTDFGKRGETVKVSRILPLHRSHFETGADLSAHWFEYEPCVEEVLAHVVHSYVAGFVYSAFVDSFCAEQNARMVAMSAANDNAEEILARLSLEYNRSRQAAITQEITEVTSGAKAMKKGIRK